MRLALVTLSDAGARVAVRLAAAWPECDLFLHGSIEFQPAGPTLAQEGEGRAAGPPLPPGEGRGEGARRVDEPSATSPHPNPLPEGEGTVIHRFERIIDLTREIFAQYDGLVYVAPTGVVVRAVAPLVEHKTVDPAVVVVDVGGRWAVSLLSGHEGGANDLAIAVANVLGAEPVISTTSEAAKTLIVGLGCRRGTAADTIIAAVGEALEMAGCSLAQVRLLASADLKADEPGLIEAAGRLGVPLRLIPAEELCATIYAFEPSALAQEKVGLPAVAEPSALLAGRRTRLLLKRQILHGVTVAIAREDCTSLASAPADPST